jgi:hypothetical protein
VPPLQGRTWRALPWLLLVQVRPWRRWRLWRWRVLLWLLLVQVRLWLLLVQVRLWLLLVCPEGQL